VLVLSRGGFCPKDSTKDALTKPLRNDVVVAAIRHALARSHAALRQQSEMRAWRTCYASLTRRECEVMALVVSGLLNKQVAGELGTSEITVKAHRGRRSSTAEHALRT
jgi:FixJ family two-component response regulator